VSQKQLVLAGGEVVLKGHARHAAEPLPDLYFAAVHAVQAPPSGPVYPPAHTHAVWSALPAGETELPGQDVQACAPAVDL